MISISNYIDLLIHDLLTELDKEYEYIVFEGKKLFRYKISFNKPLVFIDIDYSTIINITDIRILMYLNSKSFVIEGIPGKNTKPVNLPFDFIRFKQWFSGNFTIYISFPIVQDSIFNTFKLIEIILELLKKKKEKSKIIDVDNLLIPHNDIVSNFLNKLRNLISFRVEKSSFKVTTNGTTSIYCIFTDKVIEIQNYPNLDEIMIWKGSVIELSKDFGRFVNFENMIDNAIEIFKTIETLKKLTIDLLNIKHIRLEIEYSKD